MGIRAELTQLTPEEFDQILSGEDSDTSESEKWSIENLWSEFNELFKEADPPLVYMIVGDCRHPEFSHDLEEFTHDFYMGLMSPQLVQQIAPLLDAITATELRRLYADRGMDFDDSSQDMFDELKSAYAESAAAENALMIVVC
jgi:hypothetical protein